MDDQLLIKIVLSIIGLAIISGGVIYSKKDHENQVLMELFRVHQIQ